MAFTEHGVLQLSNVLSSERAIQMSFMIIDDFVKLREILNDNTELRLMIEQIQRKLGNPTKSLETVCKFIVQLIAERRSPHPYETIGFKLPHQ